MTKAAPKKPPEKKVLQIGDLPHAPHYEVRTASQSYSNIAAVLAGFAFAAVILVMQSSPLSPSPDDVIFRDQATIAFLLSFVGCIISAFVFATVTGEEVLAPRSHTMALLGGAGFSISTNLVILGLAILTRIFLSPNIYAFVQKIFPLIMFLSPLFVVFSAIDPIIGFEGRQPTRKEWALLLTFSFAPLLFSLLIRYGVGGFPVATRESMFNISMSVALLGIAFSAASSLWVSSCKGIRFKLSVPVSALLIGMYSFIIGLFIWML